VGSFYGDKTRVAASILIAVSWIGVIAVQIVASGKVLGAVLGGEETIFMIACTAVFVIYTVHGGQSSVVRTDLVQFAIIIAGMIILFCRALDSAGPGLLLQPELSHLTRDGRLGCALHAAGGGLSLSGRA